MEVEPPGFEGGKAQGPCCSHLPLWGRGDMKWGVLSWQLEYKEWEWLLEFEWAGRVQAVCTGQKKRKCQCRQKSQETAPVLLQGAPMSVGGLLAVWLLVEGVEPMEQKGGGRIPMETYVSH